ncbi:MAG: hypothetical protein ABI769_01845 [Pseudomonadota bacterium]
MALADTRVEGTITEIGVIASDTMPGNAGGDPYFELRFRVLVN